MAAAYQFNARAFDRDVEAFRARLARVSGQAVRQVEARALNRAAASCATRTRRELAAVKGLPQRVIAKRISAYKADPKKAGEITARVWIGVKRAIRVAELPNARTILKGAKAGTLKAGRLEVRPFKARMKSGRVGQFVRVVPGSRRSAGRPATSSANLPIEEPKIRLQPEAGPILEQQAAAAMRTVYVNELRRLLVRALKA